MMSDFDLRALSNARTQDLMHQRQAWLLIGVVSSAILGVFLIIGPGDRLPAPEFVVAVAAFAGGAVMGFLVGFGTMGSSGVSMTLDSEGVHLVRPGGRKFDYPWETVGRTMRVIDGRMWMGQARIPESGKLYLRESALRRTALTESAFDALVSAAKSHGLSVRTEPMASGSSMLVHRFANVSAT